VYVEATARLGIEPSHAAAIEDSTSGLLAARRAGLAVIAIPNRSFPPAPEALDAADVVLESPDELDPDVVRAAFNRSRRGLGDATPGTAHSRPT
jgi:beta-phosphoglucomutase-like phosphatase (HAD superfamily)